MYGKFLKYDSYNIVPLTYFDNWNYNTTPNICLIPNVSFLFDWHFERNFMQIWWLKKARIFQEKGDILWKVL